MDQNLCIFIIQPFEMDFIGPLNISQLRFLQLVDSGLELRPVDLLELMTPGWPSILDLGA